MKPPTAESIAKGSGLGNPTGCELGSFRRKWRSDNGQYAVANCDKPMVTTIGNVRICADCLAKVEAIAKDAKRSIGPEARTPVTNFQTRMLQ